LLLPKELWAAMKTAPRVELSLPLAWRVRGLLQEYSHLTDGTQESYLMRQLKLLGPASQKRQHWIDLASARRWPELVEDLLLSHYDLSYSRSSGRRAGTLRCQDLHLSDGTPESYKRAAEDLLSKLPDALARQ